jgi:hypothetical protein
MCSIYVINVGANTSHYSQARSPIFDDESFVYVSFCADPKKETHYSKYPPEMIPFTNPSKRNLVTHNDPNWTDMTYGDVCERGRGASLKNVIPGDILLFWGLLWYNKRSDWKSFIGRKRDCWKDFTNGKGWYILGALRVEKIIETEKELEDLSLKNRCRAENNIHFHNGNIQAKNRIFLGNKDKKYSGLFDKAVKLWIPKTESRSEWKTCLLYKTFKAADGRCLSLNDNPRWNRSLRACRKMWDISIYKELKLAEHVRDEIQRFNPNFDLLANL